MGLLLFFLSLYNCVHVAGKFTYRTRNRPNNADFTLFDTLYSVHLD